MAGGGKGPNLFRTTQDTSRFFEAVAAGTEGTTMPAFGSLLTPEQIWKIHAFLVSRDRLE